MTAPTTEPAPPTVGGALTTSPVDARYCANRAAAALARAEFLADRGNDEAADSLTRVADAWRGLAVDITRNVDMAPPPADPAP